MSILIIALFLMILFAILLYTVLIYTQRKIYQPAKNNYRDTTYLDIRVRKKVAKKKVGKILKKVDFPASSRDVVKFAEDQDASPETLTILEKLPDHIYDNADQMMKKV